MATPAVFQIRWGNLQNLRAFQQAAKVLGSKETFRISRFAFNQACDVATTRLKRDLVLQTALNYRDVNDAITISRASQATGFAYRATGASPYFSFSHFKPRPAYPLGVVARPWWRSQLFPRTFIIEEFGGNVFKRVGPGRMDIEKLYGPSVGREMERPPLPENWEKQIQATVGPAVARKLETFMPW